MTAEYLRALKSHIAEGRKQVMALHREAVVGTVRERDLMAANTALNDAYMALWTIEDDIDDSATDGATLTTQG